MEINKQEFTTAEKIMVVQGSKEIKDAVALLIAVFEDCKLNDFIKLTYEVDAENGKETFELILNKINKIC